jgi:hypothetical protein
MDRLRPTAREPPLYCRSGHVCFFLFFFFFIFLWSRATATVVMSAFLFFFFFSFFFLWSNATPAVVMFAFFFLFFLSFLSEGIGCFYYTKSLGGYHHFNCHSLQTPVSHLSLLFASSPCTLRPLFYICCIKSQTMALYVKPISIPTHSIFNLF